ncbi:MAG: hypothetical protein Ct9H300mP12_04940 [Acidimicrobiales bacterium]|nr:MAG: hypothetical protein Ct9H300mP12_04940 [Acidimicrobiales bacterium]
MEASFKGVAAPCVTLWGFEGGGVPSTRAACELETGPFPRRYWRSWIRDGNLRSAQKALQKVGADAR